jgi:hypothetical protein
MTLAAEMGSVAKIHILIFIKTGSGMQKLIGGIHKHTDRMQIA